MDVDLIFRIAAVGILVAVLVVEQISRLFSMMKSVFGF